MKEKIEKRIQELYVAKEQFLANVNACDGAIMELKALLVEQDKPKEEEIPN